MRLSEHEHDSWNTATSSTRVATHHGADEQPRPITGGSARPVQRRDQGGASAPARAARRSRCRYAHARSRCARSGVPEEHRAAHPQAPVPAPRARGPRITSRRTTASRASAILALQEASRGVPRRAVRGHDPLRDPRQARHIMPKDIQLVRAHPRRRARRRRLVLRASSRASRARRVSKPIVGGRSIVVELFGAGGDGPRMTPTSHDPSSPRRLSCARVPRTISNLRGHA